MSNPYLKLLALVVFVISFINPVKATHIAGGDISYECVGTDSFLVTLTLFRDCAGVAAPGSATINFTSTCGGSTSLILVNQSSQEVSQLCALQIGNSTCNGGAWPGLEEHIYSGIVVLSPPCNTWTMSFSTCCRNNQISNLTNPGSLGNYLYTTMYSGVDACNSSPTFTSLPAPYVCKDQLVNYNFGVVEADGDSIVYFMSPGFELATSLVPYSGTYTFTQPLPGANLVLNAQNGQLTFTPSAVGVYVVAVRIEEYERVTGIIKGTSIRDIQVVVQSCASNNQPVISSPGIFNFSGSGTLIDSNTIEVCIGDSFNFDIAISDIDTLQTVNILHNIYQSLDSTVLVTITNGNPAILNVSWTAQPGSVGSKYFSITGMDNACPVSGFVGSAFEVIIHSAVYAGLDQTICDGSQWAGLQVEGGSSFTWTTISGSAIDTIPTSPNFNMTCWHCDNPSVSPQVTTTYVVYSNLVGTCGSVDTVTVNVTPDFNLTLPVDTSICVGNSLDLLAVTSNSALTYSYEWSPDSVGDTLSNLNVTPLSSTGYFVTVTSVGGCIKTNNLLVDVYQGFPYPNVIQGDTVLCLGESTSLDLQLGDNNMPNCGISNAPCVGFPGSGIVGTGSLNNTSTSFPSPYVGSYMGGFHQMLFLASELKAMGMQSGKISAIYFDVAWVGTVTNFKNFEVKLGCTNVSDLSGGLESCLVTVLPGYTHNLTIGWNKHEFINEYDWDGVSNLLIQICFNNTVATPNGAALIAYSTTTFASTSYYAGNNNGVCAIQPFITGINSRPNVKFDYCAGVDTNGFMYAWSPSASVDSVDIMDPLVSPGTTTNYQVIIQDTGGNCADTVFHQIEVVTTFDAGFLHQSPYCLNDVPQFITPMKSGGVFTGAGISSNGLFNPSTAGVGTWPINYTLTTPALCANDSIMLVEVLPLADASFTNLEVCINADSIILQPVTSGGYWTGPGMSDSSSGVFRTIGLTQTSYAVVYTLTNPCTVSDTQWVKILSPYNFSFSNSIVKVCAGSSVNLSSKYTLSNGPHQGSNPLAIWSDSTGLVNGNGVFDASNVQPGDYTVFLTVEGTDGNCGTTKSIIVRVKALEYPEFLTDNFCINQTSAKLYVSPWLYGTGITLTQNPLSPLEPNDTLVLSPFGQNGQFTPSLRGVGHWEMTLSFTNSQGCTGTVIDTVHVLNPPDTTITHLGSSLFAEAGIGYQYQWLDCNDNMNPIVGATHAMFTPTVIGKYAVKISAGTCITTSGCFETWPVGIQENGLDLGIQIYPNPVAEVLNFDLGNNKNVTIELLDAQGKIILSQKSNGKISTIDMRIFSSGIYVVKLSTAMGVQTQRILKK